MLTGDSTMTTQAILRKPGIIAVEAEVLPDQKATAITKLKSRGPLLPWRVMV